LLPAATVNPDDCSQLIRSRHTCSNLTIRHTPWESGNRKTPASRLETLAGMDSSDAYTAQAVSGQEQRDWEASAVRMERRVPDASPCPDRDLVWLVLAKRFREPAEKRCSFVVSQHDACGYYHARFSAQVWPPARWR
jgi:hypothetical protein